MPRQVLLFSGASAVGKTSVLKSLLPLLAHGGMAPCVCKIDCLKTRGRGCLSKPGASLCHRFERGYLP